MKKVSKVLCMVLALTMVFSITACSSKTAESNSTTEGNKTTAEATTQKAPAVPVNLGILMGGDNTPAENNIVLKELSKRTNTNINMIYVPTKDLPTKLSTMIASDSLPDIFPVATIGDAVEFKKAGLMAEVGKLVKDYAPNIIKNVGDNIPKCPVNNDGTYLILDAVLPYCSNLCIRTDWLKNLGMSMPTDLDSLYKVYYAFTYNDPDKDGKKDTFGLAANSDPIGFASIFGAYGIPAMRNIELQDGTVTSWIKHPKFLEAMEYIRKLNSEGLFEPDWATIPAMDMYGKLWNGVAGAIEFNCVGPTNNWMPGRYTEKPAPTFDFAIIKGPDGLSGVPAAHPSYSSGYAFSSKCKDLTAAVKFANYCMSEEGNELLYLGIEGTMYKWIDKANGKYELLGEYKDSTAHRAAGAFCYSRLFAPTLDCQVRTFNKQTQDGVALARKSGLPDATIIASLPAEEEFRADMDKIIQEMYVKLIVTKGDLKPVYDSYISNWEKAGGTEWEKQATEAYKNEKSK